METEIEIIYPINRLLIKKNNHKKILFSVRSQKLVLHTGNGIIETGNGIISPTYRPLIEKLLLQKVSVIF